MLTCVCHIQPDKGRFFQFFILFNYIIQASEDETESGLSHAPTQIYMSPWDTPRNRSTIDLTLTREVTEDDVKSLINKKLSKLDFLMKLLIYHFYTLTGCYIIRIRSYSAIAIAKATLHTIIFYYFY